MFRTDVFVFFHSQTVTVILQARLLNSMGVTENSKNSISTKYSVKFGGVCSFIVFGKLQCDRL